MATDAKKVPPLYLREKKTNRGLLNRSMLSEYTSGHREMRQMDDAEFLNYATWLLCQQDVYATEDIKDAIEKTKNAKDIKTYSDFVKISKTVMTTLLLAAILFIMLVIPLYAYWFKKDIVKRVINYHLFPLIFYLVVMFGFYVFLYLNMNSLVKKIMTLL
jgi:uncharacterized glyoxalase superfamily metalloenzyme YdcJ